MPARPSERRSAARRRRGPGPQHSAAALRTAEGPDQRRSLAVALAADVVVAAAKLGAGLLTGSAALLAEAAHSAADSTNVLLLAVARGRSRLPADAGHPLGYGGAGFLWAFLATLASFLIGGCLSISLAIENLIHGDKVDHVAVALIVLAIAALADGTSLVQTLASARREAARWGVPVLRFLRMTSDPTLRALAVEDSAALVGVAIAAGGLLVQALGGPASSDAIASLLIGVLLCITAAGLARPLADLLIGRSIEPQRLRVARDVIASSPAVEEILDLYAVFVAPHEALLAARVHPTENQTADQLATRLDRLDVDLRRELPEVGEVFIDVTAT